MWVRSRTTPWPWAALRAGPLPGVRFPVSAGSEIRLVAAHRRLPSRSAYAETCDPDPGSHRRHDDDRLYVELCDAGEPVPEVAARSDPASRAQEQATGRELEVTDGFLATKSETPAGRPDRVPPATMSSRNVIQIQPLVGGTVGDARDSTHGTGTEAGPPIAARAHPAVNAQRFVNARPSVERVPEPCSGWITGVSASSRAVSGRRRCAHGCSPDNTTRGTSRATVSERRPWGCPDPSTKPRWVSPSVTRRTTAVEFAISRAWRDQVPPDAP